MAQENISKDTAIDAAPEPSGLTPGADRGFKLGNLKPRAGAARRKKRVGAGRGSGHGKTCGRGHKGQRAHSSRPRFGFEGGQMPLIRRIPKRGFKSINRKEYQTVNIGKLNIFADGEEVSPAELVKRGLLRSIKKPVKILGGGDFAKSLTVHANGFSKKAIEKIEAAGGKVLKC